MNQSRIIRTCVATGLALGLTIGLSACGKAAEKLSEKAAEKVVEKAAGDGANVDINSKDGTFSIETDEGSFNVGGGEVPDDWPSDVPVPDKFTVMSNMNLSSGDEVNMNMSGTTSMSVDDVIDFYSDAMSAWKESGKTSMTSDGQTVKNLMLSRDDEMLTISASDSDDDGTTIVLMYNRDPSNTSSD